MEPCAPGTEDEPPIMYATLTKQESEQERLLKQKAILKNGRYENVFELSYVNGTELWFCRACECPVMGRVFQHEIGKRHSQSLANTNRLIDRQQKEEMREEPETISIAPGEPVPPGFEDAVNRISQIQERLDAFKVGPLVALEYLLELQDYDPSKEPVYLCILCDKRGDPRTVLTHLASYNHISQYLQKHFPTCYRSLAPYMTKQYKRNWQVTLQKIAEGIETKFGRLKPYPIEKDKFEKDRLHYLQMISKGKHFSEQSGWTFEELVVHDELTKSHEDEKNYENSANHNWGGASYIQKPFKKRSPSPPVVAVPSKRTRGNAQTNPRPKTQPNVQSTPASKEPVKGKAKTSPQIQTQPQKQIPAQIQKQSQKPIQSRRRSLSSVSSISSNDDLGDSKPPKKNQPPNRNVRNRSPVQRGRQLPYARRRSPSPRRRSPSPRRRGAPPPRRRSPSPRPLSPRSKRVERDRLMDNYQRRKVDEEIKMLSEKETEKLKKIEEFRKLARAIENDMHKTLTQHEKNPEKHPQYNEEWKKFWNRRYKELQLEGVDVSKYDFKPEWIEFWNRRMVEIHSDELRSRKEALRKRLGLPEEINPIKFKIGQQAFQSPKPNLPMAAQPDQDNEVIVIDDKDDDSKSRNRSHSPWEKEAPGRSRAYKGKRSRERSPDRDKRVDRTARRSRERVPSNRSHSRDRSDSRKDLSPSRALSPLRSKELPYMRHKSHSQDDSPFRDSRSKDYSPQRESSRSRDTVRMKDHESRERRSYSRERSWERRDVERKRPEYRESSYERDIRGRERVRTVADLPWEREKAYRNMIEDYYKPPPIMRDVTRKPVVISDIPLVLPPDDHDDDVEVNVVDVLRILTALEERLGSLGPKVIDLLAQALALEKKEANSSETLLDSDLNCVLFETIKEKLKGQLLTGLVDIIQERAFKKAIKKIASLLHLAGQRKHQRDRMMPKVKPVTVPGVGAVDRAAVAKQIANALIMQGKTDVTQAELEQLINAVVGMAEASKNTNKPMTTASFLQQLPGRNIFEQSKGEKESMEKIIFPSSAKKNELVDLERLTEPLTPSPGISSTKDMENLSDSDLQTLLQNFKDLSTDEQHNLINYLKKLEYQEPERVEKLRQFVSLESVSKSKEEDSGEPTKKSGRESPFSTRPGDANTESNDLVKIESDEEDMDYEKKEEESEEKAKPAAKGIHVDSEEEDYTFEDVVKTVSKNVKDQELESNMKIVKESMKFESAKTKPEADLTIAKDLISNLMSNISKSNSSSKSVDLLGLGGSSSSPIIPTSNILTSTADFAKTLSNINIANLASIVSNVKNMSSVENTGSKLNFVPPSPIRNTEKLNFDLSHLNKPQSPKYGSNYPQGGPGAGPGIPDSFNRFDRRLDDTVRPFSSGSGLGLSGYGGASIGLGGTFRSTSMTSSSPFLDRGLMGLNRVSNAGLSGPSDFGSRDNRSLGQFNRNSAPFGSNFGSSLSTNQYSNMRGPRPLLDQRNNPRFSSFGGNDYNRPGQGGNFSRW